LKNSDQLTTIRDNLRIVYIIL